MVSHPKNIFSLFHLNSVEVRTKIGGKFNSGNISVNRNLKVYADAAHTKHDILHKLGNARMPQQFWRVQRIFNYLQYLETYKEYAVVMKTVFPFSLNIFFEICLVPKRNYRVF